MIQVEMLGRIVRVNLTMNEALLARVDAAASARGISRSGYVVEAVRDRLRVKRRDAASAPLPVSPAAGTQR